MAKNRTINPAAGLFSNTSTPDPLPVIVPPVTEQVKEPPMARAVDLQPDPPVQRKAAREKEKTRPVTFLLTEQLDKRLLDFIYSQKREGIKVTQTQIIADALAEYFDKHDI